MSRGAYRLWNEIKRNPEAVWQLIRSTLLRAAAFGSFAIAASYLVGVALWSYGWPWWGAVGAAFVVSNVLHIPVLLRWSNTDALCDLWAAARDRKLDKKVDTLLMEVADRRAIVSFMGMIAALGSLVAAGWLTWLSLGGWGLLPTALFSWLTVVSFVQRCNQAASRLLGVESEEGGAHGDLLAASAEVIGGRRPLISEERCPDERILLMPNLAWAGFLLNWKLFTALAVLACSVIITTQFYDDLSKLFGFTTAPAVFSVCLAAASGATRIVFALRVSAFQSVCFRRFDAGPGHIARSVIAPVLGCFGEASLVSDESLEKNPGMLDGYQERGSADPMDMPIFVPDRLIGAVTYFSFGADWKPEVKRIIAASDLIVIDTTEGMTKNMLWELEEAQRRLPASRIVRLMRTPRAHEERLVLPNENDEASPLLLLYQDTIKGRFLLRRDLAKIIRGLC